MKPKKPRKRPPREGEGRPSDLTPALIETVKQLLPTAMYIETVADYIGVTRWTLRNWIRRGSQENRRLQRKGARPKPQEALYLQFFTTFKRAISEGELGTLHVLNQAARSGQWQAGAWLLERRFPDRWGRKDRVHNTHEGGAKPIEIVTVRFHEPEPTDPEPDDRDTRA